LKNDLVRFIIILTSDVSREKIIRLLT